MVFASKAAAVRREPRLLGFPSRHFDRAPVLLAPALAARRAREPPSLAASRLGRPNKSKQNQAKLLGFTWFCLVESGLFNGLRVKK
jgi:hypothetical protein